MKVLRWCTLLPEVSGVYWWKPEADSPQSDWLAFGIHTAENNKPGVVYDTDPDTPCPVPVGGWWSNPIEPTEGYG